MNSFLDGWVALNRISIPPRDCTVSVQWLPRQFRLPGRF